MRQTTINGLIGTLTGTLDVIKVAQALNCGSILNVNPVPKNHKASEESVGINAQNQRFAKCIDTYKDASLEVRKVGSESDYTFNEIMHSLFHIRFYFLILIAIEFHIFYFSFVIKPRYTIFPLH